MSKEGKEGFKARRRDIINRLEGFKARNRDIINRLEGFKARRRLINNRLEAFKAHLRFPRTKLLRDETASEAFRVRVRRLRLEGP